MITLIPYKYKTLVLPLKKEEVLYLLESVTETPENRPFFENKEKIKGLVKFNGVIREDRFSISKKCSHPQYFIPLIKGSIYPAKDNTIVRLTFRLFPHSSIMLTLVTVISLFLAGTFILLTNEKYAGITVGLGFLNYLVAYGNFQIHTKDGLAELVNTLSFD